MTYYTFTDGVPVASSRGTSLSIRNEFQQISDGFQLVATAIAGIGTTNINASLPSQVGKSGRPFITDGTNTKWASQVYIDQSGGNVAIGPYTSTAPPVAYFTVSKNVSAAIPAPTPLSVLQFAEADGVGLNATLDSFGAAAGSSISFRQSGGTGVVPTATLIGNKLGALYSYGRGATGYSATSRATLQSIAAENWTDAAQGTYWSFYTTPTGSVIPVERLRITDAGLQQVNGALDVTGIQTNSGNTQPDFSYYKSANDSTSGTGTIIFNTARYTQQGTGYNLATGVFTVATTGFYDIDAVLTFTATGVDIAEGANVKVNGVIVAKTLGYLAGATTGALQITLPVHVRLFLVPGDLVTVSSLTAIAVGNILPSGLSNSYFAGRLVG